MRPSDPAERLRDVGLTPTIQRLAILEVLSRTKKHPTADQVLETIRKKHPSISRATVYNTLDALTKAGVILRLTVDPSVTRYDADLGPHAHFRCRVCNRVYDIPADRSPALGKKVEGHVIESVRTYAYGICATCLESGNDTGEKNLPTSSDGKNETKTRSSTYPTRSIGGG